MRHWQSQARPSGFSLIEVIASLFLVGTLLVAILTAQRQSVRQMIMAGHRLEAVAALDQLLTGRDDPNAQTEEELPDNKLAGDNPFYWRASQRADSASETLGAVVLRIEVYDPQYREGETLAAVEMLAAGTSISGEFP